MRTDVDPDDAPPAFDARDLDLVCAHKPGAVDVDQLPVEQVFAEQQLALASLERLQVEPRLRESDAAMLDLGDLLGWDEDEPAGDLGDGAADRRVLVLAKAHDEIVDPAELTAVRIGELAARDEREVKDGGCGCGGAHGST